VSPREELEAELAAQLSEYRAALPSKLERIESLAAAGDLKALARELHTLAGSAGTFGLPKVSAAARAAEEAVFLQARELELRLRALRHEACVT
jgi:HPt (histidine-containing phosphotransfer) domain-containing protein